LSAKLSILNPILSRICGSFFVSYALFLIHESILKSCEIIAFAWFYLSVYQPTHETVSWHKTKLPTASFFLRLPEFKGVSV